MVEIAALELAEVCGAQLAAGSSARMCRGCAIDSRAVAADGIFVAFPGEKVDGNAFAASALKAGAGAVVLTRDPEPELAGLADKLGAAVLVSEDPERFLQRLASWWRGKLACKVVGVTGSVGKTSTKDMLRALLATTFKVHATAGNYNNLIGLPLTVLSAPLDAEVLVLEMGMNHVGEISALTRVARPDYAVITKVGTSHIGMLGSREAIACAKAEVLEGMVPSDPADPGSPALFLTAEDDYTSFIEERFARPAGVEVVRCGYAESCAVRAENVELDEEGRPSFTVVYADGERRSAKLSLTGRHSVSNALLAAAVADRLGVGRAEAVAAFAAMPATRMRQEQVTAQSGTRVIDDSYNASPDSTAAALDVLMALPCDGSRVAVLGEIGELGSEAARLHGLVGAYAAAKRPDLLICVGGEGACAMADAARLMGMPDEDVAVASDVEEACERYAGAFGAHDLVLVKGSRSVGLDMLVKEVCSR